MKTSIHEYLTNMKQALHKHHTGVAFFERKMIGVEWHLTAACWYLGDGETPGAIAHSQRPSLCFARPYALERG
jgi:hypothetical protein